MNYSFASISADHLGYNVTIFDVDRDSKLIRILSSENSLRLSYEDIVNAIPNTIDRAILSGTPELMRQIAKGKQVPVIKPKIVDSATSLCTMADKLNSGKIAVASKHEKEILSSLRSSTPDEVPHNIRSLINICDSWSIWTNYDSYRSPNHSVRWC